MLHRYDNSTKSSLPTCYELTEFVYHYILNSCIPGQRVLCFRSHTVYCTSNINKEPETTWNIDDNNYHKPKL